MTDISELKSWIAHAEEDFAAGGSGFVFLVGRKALAEVFVNFGEAMDGAMKHDGQTGFAKAAAAAGIPRIAVEKG